MSENKVILFSLLALLYFGKIVHTKKREKQRRYEKGQKSAWILSYIDSLHKLENYIFFLSSQFYFFFSLCNLVSVLQSSVLFQFVMAISPCRKHKSSYKLRTLLDGMLRHCDNQSFLRHFSRGHFELFHGVLRIKKIFIEFLTVKNFGPSR